MPELQEVPPEVQCLSPADGLCSATAGAPREEAPTTGADAAADRASPQSEPREPGWTRWSSDGSLFPAGPPAPRAAWSSGETLCWVTFACLGSSVPALHGECFLFLFFQETPPGAGWDAGCLERGTGGVQPTPPRVVHVVFGVPARRTCAASAELVCQEPRMSSDFLSVSLCAVGPCELEQPPEVSAPGLCSRHHSRGTTAAEDEERHLPGAEGSRSRGTVRSELPPGAAGPRRPDWDCIRSRIRGTILHG